MARTGTKPQKPAAPKPEKRGRGRPSPYSDAQLEVARKAAALGATDVQIADILTIDVATLYRWKNQHDEFREALRASKEVIDGAVEQSLFRRAMGYSHPAVKIMVVDGAVVREEYTEHYPPDTTACIFWLKNRKPQEWRDKSEVEITDVAGRLDAARKRALARKG
jgi:hypothetical protein